jgi:cytochrome c peroxidase
MRDPSGCNAGPSTISVYRRPRLAANLKFMTGAEAGAEAGEEVGSIVRQQFRSLAARPPYFSNGSAKTLRDVIDFYDRRVGSGYTDKEKTNLENFLEVL